MKVVGSLVRTSSRNKICTAADFRAPMSTASTIKVDVGGKDIRFRLRKVFVVDVTRWVGGRGEGDGFLWCMLLGDSKHQYWKQIKSGLSLANIFYDGKYWRNHRVKTLSTLKSGFGRHCRTFSLKSRVITPLDKWDQGRYETYPIPGETLIPGGRGKRFTLVLDMQYSEIWVQLGMCRTE